MANPQPAIQIFSSVANGTHDWSFGSGASYAGDAGNMTIRASAIGSGAVGAVVSAYRGATRDRFVVCGGNQNRYLDRHAGRW